MKKGESPVRASSPKKARQWAEEIIELPRPHLTEYLTGSFKVDKKGSTLDGEGMATDTLSFDVTIYQDALALLLGGKADIRAEIMSQLQQGDPALEDIANDYNYIIRQKNAIKIRMNRTAAMRLGYDCMSIDKPDLSASFGVVGQKALKEDNISFAADDGIKIQISTKDGIHPLIIDFLNHWKQMIMYLNNEENRYLAEFRDALLPELLSGKIEVKDNE